MVELSYPTGVVSADAVIKIDGESQTVLDAALLDLLVEETVEGLYRCEARFGNWGGTSDGAPDYQYLDRRLLDFGREISVSMGAGSEDAQIFSGFINGLEAQYSNNQPPTLTVLAEDALMNFRKARRTRSFEDMSDADVFNDIAQEHNLRADIDVPVEQQRVIAQINQSDLAFIRDRARRLDADVWTDEGTLYVQARDRRIADSDEYFLRLGVGLLEFEVLADLANQYTSVVVSGWDVGGKTTIEHEATDRSLGSELGDDDSGASILRRAFSEQVDRIARQMPGTDQEVQSLAEAAFRQQARRFVVGHGSARGDARLRVGRRVELRGLGDLFSGVYTVEEARHIFTRQIDGGYMTEFVVERPGIRPV